MKTAALIVAGGRGTRTGPRCPSNTPASAAAGAGAHPRRVLGRTPAIDLVQVVIAEGDAAPLRGGGWKDSGWQAARPRLRRADAAGFRAQRPEALKAHAPDRVLIHDAARPFVTPDVIARVLEALPHAPGAIAAMPVADTLKQAGADRRIAATLDRSQVWRAQTPQGFRFAEILAAHARRPSAAGIAMTDDAAIAEWAGLPVALVMGAERNRKLTTAEDLAMADDARIAPDVRTGQGFDVHRFAPGDHVWLCGVKLAHTHALQGHSDADVALHALTDALLGAIGAGDIGQHFPDTDARWKGAASHLFLEEAFAWCARTAAASATSTSPSCAKPPRSPPTASPCAGASRRSWSSRRPASPSRPPRRRA